MRKIIALLCIAVLLISCGGSKNVTTSRTERSTTKETSVVRIERSNKEIVSQDTPEEKSLSELPYKDKVQHYIYEFSGIAKSEMKTYGIPASITLAQGILESGAGYGELTQRANNHFGIKCHDWEGDRVYHDDDRSQECFRKYDLASESYRDHSLFLKDRKRYSRLFTFNKKDYKSWARGLREAGYATDRKYPEKLIGIIEKYQLYKFDNEVLGRRDKKKDKGVVVASSSPADSRYKVKKGDTLYSISRRYKISVEELKTYNNLVNNNIKVGQVLKVTSGDEEEDFN